MKKKEHLFIAACILPALICFIFLYIYPIFRTFVMSFYKVPTVNDDFSKWTFNSLNNYITLFQSYLFKKSMLNMLNIWTVGGITTLAFSLLIAVILTSGVKAKSFWRSLIYLPNIISAVALASMWIQYVFNSKFGLLKSIFTALHISSLAEIQWTSPNYLFNSMLFSYCFGCIGYFMLIFLAGIERIPGELYECAYLEGANKFVSFWKITLPLIRNVVRTCIMLWTISVVNFFVWSLMFSRTPVAQTVVPGVYMYNLIFGSDAGGTALLNVGAGAGVGVILTVIVMAAYALLNILMPERRMEY